MPFKKGVAANPTGTNGRKPIIDAVNTLISLPWSEGNEPDLGNIPQKLTIAHALALKLVKGGMRDDWQPGESLAYFKEICDRVYGKAPQSIEHNHNGQIEINLIEQAKARFYEMKSAKIAPPLIENRDDGGV